LLAVTSSPCFNRIFKVQVILIKSDDTINKHTHTHLSGIIRSPHFSLSIYLPFHFFFVSLHVSLLCSFFSVPVFASFFCPFLLVRVYTKSNISNSNVSFINAVRPKLKSIFRAVTMLFFYVRQKLPQQNYNFSRIIKQYFSASTLLDSMNSVASNVTMATP
jgi:hypothetical protein